MQPATIAPVHNLPKRFIAASFLPDRYFQGYTLCKLATDPLYGAICAQFDGHDQPLLDLGCGIGLLLQCLRALGNPIPYVGIDSDKEKIAAARLAATKRSIRDANFQIGDLAHELPAHHGSFALLDILQYLERPARERLLIQVARRLSPSGKAVMRIGIDDGSWRASVARSADRMGHAVRWMRSSFRSQPTREELMSSFTKAGLNARFSPLWGKTPFTNYLVIAKLSEQPKG
jgi:SAM-dependent methyltransferase